MNIDIFGVFWAILLSWFERQEQNKLCFSCIGLDYLKLSFVDLLMEQIQLAVMEKSEWKNWNKKIAHKFFFVNNGRTKSQY